MKEENLDTGVTSEVGDPASRPKKPISWNIEQAETFYPTNQEGNSTFSFETF